MEFPSFEAAREWYHSDRYKAATAIRQRAVRGHIVIVEGRPDV